MLSWVLGEKRYAYSEVISSTPVTISSATYSIFDVEDESTVASGVASISSQIVYCLWQPTEVGTYVVDFDYVVGEQTFTSRQVIEVKETM